MTNITINIAKDFSDTPGGRFKKDGKHSGEEFRDDILNNKVIEAINKKTKIIVDLDGCMGYPSSFLDESFGVLSRKLRTEGIDLLNIIEFISNDQKSLIETIKGYMSHE